MVNQIQKKVIRHLRPKDLKKIIRKKEIEASVLEKLLFIQILYKGKWVDEACDLMDISLSTGHRWLDEWNDGSVEGLYPKYHNGGRKSKLNHEQLEKLDVLMYNEPFLNTVKVHELIKKNFNVDYSLSRVREIVHKLGYSYKKGYVTYSKMPEDAEEILKKN